jgi:hypothetical protein
MKNIHILPTDKLSRLGRFIDTNNLFLRTTDDIPRGENINIYITSEEEIKDCWFLNTLSNEIGFTKGSIGIPKNAKKIILTTDQDLIKDGVQAIDDEFLEWFVKNPSCDSVEVERGYLGMGGFVKSSELISKDKLEYKIIIPKEESKQEILEEVAENFWLNDDSMTDNDRISYVNGFLACAKWQQERMYSEKEVIKIVEKSRETGLTAEFLLLTEQFKKK